MVDHAKLVARASGKNFAQDPLQKTGIGKRRICGRVHFDGADSGAVLHGKKLFPRAVESAVPPDFLDRTACASVRDVAGNFLRHVHRLDGLEEGNVSHHLHAATDWRESVFDLEIPATKEKQEIKQPLNDPNFLSTIFGISSSAVLGSMDGLICVYQSLVESLAGAETNHTARKPCRVPLKLACQ